jgi:hypothetical protein
MVLRSLLRGKAPHLFDSTGEAHVDPIVLDTLLFRARYKHGLRSMEAILDMSLLSECKGEFEQAALPPKSQLKLHVDLIDPSPAAAAGTPPTAGRPPAPPAGPAQTPPDFVPADADALALATVEEADFDPEAAEKIARQIHERYRQKHLPHLSPNDPARRDWEELPEDFRSSNITQAAHIPVKLRRIGYYYEPADGVVTDNPNFDEDTEVETLAEMEHDRWVEEKKRQGWQHGPHRDPGAKLNPLLDSWDKLPESIREMNRQMVREIPELMGAAGFRIYRRPK